jgi:hypothetical protein
MMALVVCSGRGHAGSKKAVRAPVPSAGRFTGGSWWDPQGKTAYGTVQLFDEAAVKADKAETVFNREKEEKR